MKQSEFLLRLKKNDKDHSLHLYLCLQEQKGKRLTFIIDITFFCLTVNMASFMRLEAQSSWKYGRYLQRTC